MSALHDFIIQSRGCVRQSQHNSIDGLLSTQDYEKQNQRDDISILTLKKDTSEPKTYSRVLAGRRVFANREQFGFEVRL